MERFGAFALIVVLALALVLGVGAGVGVGIYHAWQSPAVVEQIARQEAARADKLSAEAEAEKHQAAAVGAWSRSEQVLAIELSRRWPVVVALVLVALALALVGTSGAWVRWTWRRSEIQALPGGLLAVARGGGSVIIDPARMVGGLVVVDQEGVRPVLQVGEELTADVARAALVAGAVQKVGANETRAELAARVSESLSAAFSNLAGAVASPRQLAAVPPSPALRLVRIRSAAERQKDEAASDAAELREFVEVGALTGFQRSKWAGYKFKSTGRACTQTRWAILAGWLREMSVLDGHVLTVSPADVLRRLGFETEPKNCTL